MASEVHPRIPRLFLSYGHRDATELALRLHDEFERAGYSVWQDKERIRASRAWTDEIRTGLRESQLVVALLSPHSVRRTDWSQNADDQDSVCLDEIEYAVDACKIPVFPVMAVTCEPPFRIFRLQFVDFRGWQESEARYESLKKVLLDGVAECLATGRAPLRKWQRLPEPWDYTAFLAERRHRFIGRTWLFDSVHDRLVETASPALLLTGRPGVGKSAFFASLVHANPAGQILGYHCCQATTPATLSPAVFVRSLAAMIAARDADYAGMIENPEMLTALDEGKVAADPASAFERLILNPLQKLPPPETAPRLLMIDALDEALSWPGSPNLLDVLSARLGAFPKWLKLVLTTRDEPAVRRRFRSSTVLELSADQKENAHDLRNYIAVRLDSDPLRGIAGERRGQIGGRVLARAKGNFLVTAQTLDALESKLLDADDLDALAPGLDPLYREFFHRLFMRAGVNFAPSRKVLQAILASPEPPSRDELAAVTGLGSEDDLPPILGRLASLVPPRDGRYTPFHQTLAEWLTGWNREEDQPVAGEYYISRTQGHGLWADALLPLYRRGPAAWDISLRRYLPTHLVGAERWDDLADALLDLRFLEAKSRGPGTSVFGLLADFELALRGFPEGFERRRLVFLISEILRLDAAFIGQFPESLFQCLWNRGYWHDSANAASFLVTAPGAVPPWDRNDPKISALVERWRIEKENETPDFPWLRALRPLPETLGSAQRGIIRADCDSFETVAISPDGSRIIASLPEAGPIGIWDAQSCAQIAFADFDQEKSVHCVRFFSAGARSGLAAAVTWDGRLILLDEALQSVSEVQASEDNFSRVAISPDGTLIATGDWKGTTALWSSETLNCWHRWQAHEERISAIEFSPCGNFLASGEDGNVTRSRIRIWGLDPKPHQVGEVETKGSVESICFSAGGDLLYWGEYDGIIERWAWQEGKRTVIRNTHDSPAGVVRLLGERRLLCGVGGAFDPVPIESWNLEEGRIEQYLHGHLFGIGDIALFPGTERFVSAGDSTLRIWDLGMRGEIQLESIEPEVTWVLFREPQGWVITGAETSDAVWVRTLADGALVRRLSHGELVSSLALSDDGGLLASGISDGSVHLWNLANDKPLWQVRHHDGPVTSLAFAPDGQLLASGGQDGRVCLVGVKTGKRKRSTLVHRGDSVKTVTFSPDSQLVASGGHQTVQVWRAQKREILLKLTIADGIFPHYQLWFARDGEILIVEGPAEQPMTWIITTKQRIPADGDLETAHDALKFRSGRRWRWHLKALGPEQVTLKLEDSRNGATVAAFPAVQGDVRWHPGGRIWANKRSRQLSLVRLEGLREN